MNALTDRVLNSRPKPIGHVSRFLRRVTRTNTSQEWAGQDSNLGPWGYEPENG